ncbi:hypothetical protein PsorP6_015872 [Peronosclerospora sorghi]|uniref:Uncharacterized protein n=1 Tax=Peronosclerospora sorghi TaxID=230839 RepID=A0ACC0WN87_9STRA|nr:hypothetical protein PsorP6_015872 [Peronosclerospora sorghi]
MNPHAVVHNSRYDARGSDRGMRFAVGPAGLQVTWVLGDDRSTIRLTDLDSAGFAPVPGLSGDLEAIINDCGYLKSSQPAAFRCWYKHSQRYRSRIPSFMVDYMMPYPNFHEQSL